MKISITDLETKIVAVHTMVFNRLIICKKWQRPFAWTSAQAGPLISQIIDTASYDAEDRPNNCVYCGNIVVFNDIQTNSEIISDGQNRTITLGLAYKALHTICCERGYDISVADILSHHHELDEARTEFLKFIDNPNGTTKYADVYRTAYKKFDAYIADQNDAEAIKDTLEHYCLANIITCSSEALAHDYFMNLNASGVPLTKTEIISSFLQFYSDKYKIKISYKYNELVEIIEAYYYKMEPDAVPAALNCAAINAFMSKYVVATREHFVNFNEFLKKANKFSNTYWYKILHNLDNKSVTVGYTLAGCDYVLDGTNKNVNDFLTDMVVSNILGFVNHMTGSATTSHFSALKAMIGRKCNIEDISTFMNSWSATRYNMNFADFSQGLDMLTHDQQKSIVLLIFYAHNQNALAVNVEVEEAYPQNAGVAWKRSGWPSDYIGKRELLKSLGNKLLLDKHTNESLGHAGPNDKALGYEEFYEDNTAFGYSENLFDMDTFSKQKKAYLDKRRDAFANFLAKETRVGPTTIV